MGENNRCKRDQKRMKCELLFILGDTLHAVTFSVELKHQKGVRAVSRSNAQPKREHDAWPKGITKITRESDGFEPCIAYTYSTIIVSMNKTTRTSHALSPVPITIYFRSAKGHMHTCGCALQHKV